MTAARGPRGRGWSWGTGALLAAIAITALASRGVGPASGQGSPPTPPPNVVLVMLDDARASDMRVMDGVQRKVAQQGVQFRNNIASFPLCCPSRASILTGQYAHNHGVISNRPPDGGFGAFDDSATLAVALRRGGYRTGYVGKYLNGYGSATRFEDYVPPGWTRWYASVVNRMFNFAMNENGRRVAYKGERNYATDVEARQAVTFIRRSSRQPKPFFLMLATRAPHTETSTGGDPLNPRPALRHRGAFRKEPLPESPAINEADVSDKPSFVPDEPLDDEVLKRLQTRNRSRLESLLAVDEAVQRVITELRQQRELGNTWIVVTDDNGYLLGEHRLVRKTRLYEESIRVPLLIRGPEAPRGATREQIVANVDLTPTILEITGVAPLKEMAIDGRSILPQIQRPDAWHNRVMLLELRNAKGIRTQRWMYAEHDTDSLLPGPDEFELYDLRADPFQLENLYEESAEPGPSPLKEKRQKLESRLDQIADCTGASCP